MAYRVKKDTSPVTQLKYLPSRSRLRSGDEVVLDRASADDEQQIYEMYKHVIELEGDSYPYYEVDGLEDFRACYMSRDTFVVKKRDPESESRVVGAFYVKPNFPGRSSHICNAGFLVHHEFRCQGVGTLMAKAMLPIARDIGYRAAMFNLVYVTNEASLKLWRKVGFREIGCIPKAGDLRGVEGYVDCIQFYYDFDDIPPEYELDEA